MSKYSLITTNDSQYDVLVEKAGGHLTQSLLYYNWQQERKGVKVERFILQRDNKPIVFWQALSSPLLFSKNQIHIPHGPIILEEKLEQEDILNLLEKLKDFAKNRQAVFIRFNPQNLLPDLRQYIEKEAKYTKSFNQKNPLTQPRFEWQTDLRKPLEDILKELPKKTRYSIKTAKKRGAKVRIITTDLLSHLDDFYNLLEETAKRNDFNLHPKNYYEHVLKEVEKTNRGFLVLIQFENKVLLANLIVIYGDTAYHVFGGSSSLHRDKLPAYLAHFAGFRQSQELGISFYNFGGIADPKENNSSWSDLTSFKKKFNGQEKDLGPSFDLPLLPFWFYLYTIRKKIKKYL